MSLLWNVSKNVSSEISKSEEGGRRGILLSSKERCGTRAVSLTNDGSLWVSKSLSQSFQRSFLRLFKTKKTFITTFYYVLCFLLGVETASKNRLPYFKVWQVHLANKSGREGQVISVLKQLMTTAINGKQLGRWVMSLGSLVCYKYEIWQYRWTYEPWTDSLLCSTCSWEEFMNPDILICSWQQLERGNEDRRGGREEWSTC